MHDLPALKPACSLIRCCSIVGAILNQSFIEFVRVAQERYRTVALRNC